ncbi:MAG: hypothetical protein U1B80_05220 [Anaerolineaceae bacterium]|nr:hypothetical protein [Anaerolineaceae bacterium]
MTIKPGKSTTVSIEFTMREKHGGPHDFRLRLNTNDPQKPELELTVLSNWVP